MNKSEKIFGLGIHSGAHLIEKSGLSEETQNETGHVFTHLGVYMSSLCMQSYFPTEKGAAFAALMELHKWYDKELPERDDREVAKALASTALDAFHKAVPTWPHPREEETAGVKLTTALKSVLEQFYAIELSNFEEARLRHLVREQFQVLAAAHAAILVEKAPPIEEKTTMPPPFWKRSWFISAAIAFSLGFVVSPHLYPKIFGFSSAEECALKAYAKHQAQMCFALYPSIEDKKNQ